MDLIKKQNRKWANKYIKNVGKARCNCCDTFDVECIRIRFSWFSVKNVCEGCVSNAFTKLKSGV